MQPYLITTHPNPLLNLPFMFHVIALDYIPTGGKSELYKRVSGGGTSVKPDWQFQKDVEGGKIIAYLITCSVKSKSKFLETLHQYYTEKEPGWPEEVLQVMREVEDRRRYH